MNLFGQKLLHQPSADIQLPGADFRREQRDGYRARGL